MPPEAPVRRLFLAVELPAVVRKALDGVRREAPELAPALRWAPPEHLHLTLRFLGETPRERGAALEAALGELALPSPFAVACRGLGVFGTATRPRVLWAGVGGDTAALSALRETVEEVCAGFGWAREAQPYSPHVTLARGRQRAEVGPALGALLARHRETPFGEAFRVEAVTLFESRLGPGGPRYVPLARRSL